MAMRGADELDGAEYGWLGCKQVKSNSPSPVCRLVLITTREHCVEV